MICQISRRNSNVENLKRQLLGAECMDATPPEVFWIYGFRCQFPVKGGDDEISFSREMSLSIPG